MGTQASKEAPGPVIARSRSWSRSWSRSVRRRVNTSPLWGAAAFEKFRPGKLSHAVKNSVKRLNFLTLSGLCVCGQRIHGNRRAHAKTTPHIGGRFIRQMEARRQRENPKWRPWFHSMPLAMVFVMLTKPKVALLFPVLLFPSSLPALDETSRLLNVNLTVNNAT